MKNKTEYIMSTAKQYVKKTESSRIKLGFSYINDSISVWKFGFRLYTAVVKEKQVNLYVTPAFVKIGLICKHINDEACRSSYNAATRLWQGIII